MSVRIPSKLTGLELVAEPLEASPELGYTWLKCPTHLNVGDHLGSGKFGAAVKVTRDDIKGSDGKNAEFVAKLFPKSHFYNTRKNVENEVKLIRKVKSEHIIRCFVLYENEAYFVAIFEFAKGGDLAQRIDKRISRGKIFNKKEGAKIIAQVLDAVARIHEEKIIHRDIKSANIFFKYADEKKSRILLGDFGFSIGKEVQQKGSPGSRTYAAPELLLGGDYGEKIDIWAIGVVAFEILSGELPFPEAKNTQELNISPCASESIVAAAQAKFTNRSIIRNPVIFPKAMMSGNFEDGEAMTDIARDFISRCLAKVPGERMSAKDALQHDWIKKNKTSEFNPKEKWNETILSGKFAKLKTTSSHSVSGREAKGNIENSQLSRLVTQVRSEAKRCVGHQGSTKRKGK